MILYNKLIFDMNVPAGTTVQSTEMAEQLGKAYDIVFEVEIDQLTGDPSDITIRPLQSNSGRNYVADPDNTIYSGDPGSTLPVRVIKPISGPRPALMGVQVVVTGASTAAHIRIWACGRSR